MLHGYIDIVNPLLPKSEIQSKIGTSFSHRSIVSIWHMWLSLNAFISVRLCFSFPSFQSPPAGRESLQSLPPEAVRTRLAAISKRVPVWERSFCGPTVPALFASEELKLLEKSVYTQAYTPTQSNTQLIIIAVFPSSASGKRDLEPHLFLISSSCTQLCLRHPVFKVKA